VEESRGSDCEEHQVFGVKGDNSLAIADEAEDDEGDNDLGNANEQDPLREFEGGVS
jgi:hypothetical protein